MACQNRIGNIIKYLIEHRTKILKKENKNSYIPLYIICKNKNLYL